MYIFVNHKSTEYACIVLKVWWLWLPPLPPHVLYSCNVLGDNKRVLEQTACEDGTERQPWTWVRRCCAKVRRDCSGRPCLYRRTNEFGGIRREESDWRNIHKVLLTYRDSAPHSNFNEPLLGWFGLYDERDGKAWLRTSKCAEIQRAGVYLLRMVQQDCFLCEIDCITRSTRVPKDFRKATSSSSLTEMSWLVWHVGCNATINKALTECHRQLLRKYQHHCTLLVNQAHTRLLYAGVSDIRVHITEK